jgi:hypothetical protein
VAATVVAVPLERQGVTRLAVLRDAGRRSSHLPQRPVERQSGHLRGGGVEADLCRLPRVGLVGDRAVANRGYPDGVFVVGQLIDDAIGPDSE